MLPLCRSKGVAPLERSDNPVLPLHGGSPPEEGWGKIRENKKRKERKEKSLFIRRCKHAKSL